jgi:hypothetical protein
MFHFPASLPHRLYIHRQVTAHNDGRVSPFGHPRINAWLTTPRGISQSPTSFISSSCQGIHRVPLTHNTNRLIRARVNNKKICSNKEDTRVHYTVLKQHEPPRRQPPTVTDQPGIPVSGVGHSRHPTTMTNQTRHTTTHDNRPTHIELWHPPGLKKAPDVRVDAVHKIKLLRKEVIQPHLPVRLPCYDFVPIADPTFDGSLTSLGHRLRVLPTFMT